MNSLVSLSLNFRLCNLPHLGISQPYFQFRWIGNFFRQNPLVSTLSAYSVTLESNFLRGSKGRYSSSFLQNFLKIFFFFFSQLLNRFSTSIFALLFKADANVQHLLPLFQIFWRVFLKVFSEPFLNLEINPFRPSPYRLAFKADAKVEPTF